MKTQRPITLQIELSVNEAEYLADRLARDPLGGRLCDILRTHIREFRRTGIWQRMLVVGLVGKDDDLEDQYDAP